MTFWSFLIPGLAGLAIAVALRKGHWAFTVIVILLLVGVGLGGAAAIEKLSTTDYAKLPLSGAQIGQVAVWSVSAAAGVIAGLIARVATGLIPRKGRKETPEPDGPEERSLTE